MTLRRFLFAALLLFTFLTPYIAPATIAASLLAALWISDAALRRHLPGALSTTPAALAGMLALLIAVSTLFSHDPLASARHLAGVTYLLVLPIAIDLLDTARKATAMILTLAASCVVMSVVGLWQYAHGGDDLANRIHAHLSHYMTFSGLAMIAGLLLLGFAFEARGRTRAVGFVAAVPICAVLLTFTRNAYVGTLAGILAYLAWRRPWALLLLPPALAVLFLLLPADVRHRVRSIGDLQDASNRDRLAMLHAGGRMISDDPLTGLGPDMVKPYYVLYRDPDATRWRVPHLHNNTLQIGAASGVFAAAAYLALACVVMGAAAGRLRRERRPLPAALLAGTLLVSVALFIAGFFEYNFGDTEIEMATLLVWAIPFSPATAPESTSD